MPERSWLFRATGGTMRAVRQLLTGASVTELDALWVRHGESTANLVRRFSHKADEHPLTPRGVEQATELSRTLNAAGLAGPIFASPLLRAQQTAAILATPGNLDVVTIEEFRELDVGDLDGQDSDAAWAIHDAVYEAWLAGNFDVAFPDGESAHEVARRLQRGYARVIDLAQADPTVIVGHGGNITIALRVLDDAGPPLGPVANCEVIPLHLAITCGQTAESSQVTVRRIRP